MAIITLTTDFGEKDPFAGAVKGAIYSELDTVRIVDISHSVSPFHITEAAYIIQNAYKNFPNGTIHIIGIDSELTPENNHIAVKLDGHYFICANNGIISLITKDIVPTEMVEINIHNRITSNFTVLDVFVQAACHIARGGTLGVIGKPIAEIKPLKGIQPVVNKSQKQIIGNVIYVDNYGNVVSNITRKLFDDIGKGRAYKIEARGTFLSKIHNTYSEAINFNIDRSRREEEGKKLAVFNSGDYVELAIYKSNPSTVGSAATLFGLDFRDTITINFED
ncbi:MAG: S-adenosylmethionine hydrolase [Flavobacteriales bacterium]|jgi:S-adenosylmethionine hydrolase